MVQMSWKVSQEEWEREMDLTAFLWNQNAEEEEEEDSLITFRPRSTPNLISANWLIENWQRQNQKLLERWDLLGHCCCRPSTENVLQHQIKKKKNIYIRAEETKWWLPNEWLPKCWTGHHRWITRRQLSVDRATNDDFHLRRVGDAWGDVKSLNQ